MTVMLGPADGESPEEWAKELSALRTYRADVLRLRSEPGHVTKAELDAAEAAYQERMRA